MEWLSAVGRIFLYLADPARFRFRRADFAVEKYYHILQLMKKVTRGTDRPATTPGTYEKDLLRAFLTMVSFAFPIVAPPLLKRYVEFFSRHSGLFASPDRLVSLYFNLAYRNFGNQGAYYLSQAEKTIRRHRWPATRQAKFAINRGSYYEKQQEYQQAIKLFMAGRRHLKTGHHALLAPLYYHLGCCHKALGRRRKAKEYFRKCLASSPGHNLAREHLDRLSSPALRNR